MTTSPSLHFSVFALAGATTLASTLALTGCQGDEFQSCQGAECGDGGEGGTDGSGGDGGGGVIPGTQYIPGPVRPSLATTLPPTRAFLSWQSGEIPAGGALAGYDICWAQSFSQIDDFAECPNKTTTTAASYLAIDGLQADSDYYWKVLARFEDGTTSDFSVPWLFKTDHSLAAWWRMDEGSGTTVVDSSVWGNNGTLVNAPQWTQGFLGQALLFGGTRSVSVADAPSLNFGTGDFSLSAWVRSNATGSHQAIINKGAYSLYKRDTGLLSFYTPGCGIIVSAGDVTPSVWHHAMVRRLGSTVSLYLDGQLTGAGNCTDNLSSGVALVLGCVAPACAEPFDGVIDDAMVTKAGKPDPLNDFCAAQALAGSDLSGTICQ